MRGPRRPAPRRVEPIGNIRFVADVLTVRSAGGNMLFEP